MCQTFLIVSGLSVLILLSYDLGIDGEIYETIVDFFNNAIYQRYLLIDVPGWFECNIEFFDNLVHF